MSEPGETQPTGKLDPQPWMKSQALQAVLSALQSTGQEVRLVGGCVRDGLAHRTVRDIDLATPLTPNQVMERLRQAGLKAVPTGIKHGTVTAVANGRPFEVTTLRRDVKTDGRHATVAFTDDWVADAARRDFTFNALSATPEGDVYDPFGGIEDLAEGRVRFVGRAEDRIEEDYLRLLRYFRFHAHYGRPPPDGKALAACRSMAPGLSRLSGERIRHEMLRLLEAPTAADVILMMKSEHILGSILPEAGDVSVLRPLIWLETKAVTYDGLGPDPLRRLAALLLTGNRDSAAVAARWRLSNRDRDRLAAQTATEPRIDPGLGEDQLRGLFYRHSAEVIRDRILSAWAVRLSVTPRLNPVETEFWINALGAALLWQPMTFPISGQDLLDLGMSRGPEVGKLLKSVEDWWIDGGCRAGRAACLAEVDRRL